MMTRIPEIPTLQKLVWDPTVHPVCGMQFAVHSVAVCTNLSGIKVT